MTDYIITEELLNDIELRIGAFYGSATIRSRPLSEHDIEIAKKERERVVLLFEEYKNSLRDIESSFIKFRLDEIIESLRSTHGRDTTNDDANVDYRGYP